ncbi:MAG: KamA family radical SAM protein [Phycisphaerae bacterium]
MKATFTQTIGNIPYLDTLEKAQLMETTNRFPFLSNSYYLSLIDWSDPNDPLRRLIIPSRQEAEPWGREDASNEKSYTRLPGLQHKYPTTVLLLVSNQCGGLCRYCFRKRIFSTSPEEVLDDLPAARNYIDTHKEITNVLLTGGDPLMLPTYHLEMILAHIAPINHIRIIRIGSKIPAFNPYRIIDDPALVDLFARYARNGKMIYIITHFDHPKEITPAAATAIELLRKTGVVLVNQTPLIRGINDHPAILAQLFRELSFIGISPYYLFQCRPALGNKTYAVPVEEGYKIFEQAKSTVSGLAKRARFVMSHSTGKIEIVGKTPEHTYFKYHRAANDKDSGRFMIFKCNPNAYWFDDYDEIVYDYPIDQPYRLYGPD